MTNKEVIFFSLFLTALIVAGFVFLGLVDQMGQQFLSVALDLNKDVTELFVSK